ncbi:MAG: hypothetical protein IRY99_13245 [Isosphaeraceae bacterium]|nr:hypothetical protein [Isosphaeraceae bacterium]
MIRPARAPFALFLLLGTSSVLWMGGAPGRFDRPATYKIDFGAANWMARAGVRRQQHWGLENLRVIADPTRRFARVLRVLYPKGSASPTVARRNNAPLGGAQFVADLGMPPREALHLRYYVRFAASFDFVKGGKLPGLCGGRIYSGQKIPDGTDGFSTRFMWRRRGDGEVYAYLPTSIEHGTSLGRGSWRFRPGTWHALEQKVVLNTPGRADGYIRVWFDGKPVLEQRALEFRTVEDLKIEGIFFSTFFGGDDPSWATPKSTYADFADFVVSDRYIGP